MSRALISLYPLCFWPIKKEIVSLMYNDAMLVISNRTTTCHSVLYYVMWCSLRPCVIREPFCTQFPGGGGTPLFGLYGDVPLDRVWFFGLAVLNRVCNLTCLCPKQVRTCPKQSMVLLFFFLACYFVIIKFFRLITSKQLILNWYIIQ